MRKILLCLQILIVLFTFSEELSSKEKETWYGVINISVANIRTRPGHNRELSDQVLLGTTVTVLRQQRDWFYIQTLDGYKGWIDEGGFVKMSENSYTEWMSKEKLIYTDYFGFVYSSSDDQSQTISDIIKGDILNIIGEKNEYFQVQFPDNRIGFVKKNASSKYDEWMSQLRLNSEQLVKTARTFVGFPYLWGGTSFKGVDCSGFTKSVYYLNGIVLPRDAYQQADVGEFITDKIELEKLQPGDLLFFGYKSKDRKKDRVKHVAMYIGDGDYIHSSGKVKINSFVKSKDNFVESRLHSFLKAKRILNSLEKNGVIMIKDSSNTSSANL